MRFAHLCTLASALFIAAPAFSIAQDDNFSRHIFFDQPTYFTAPDGTAVTIPPGQYAVEATSQDGLRLLEQTDGSPHLLRAEPLHHDDFLSDSAARLILTDEDTLHLVLLYPDGRALDAIGSLNGIRSRAPLSANTNNTAVPLTQTQLRQGLQSLSETTRLAGAPPPPRLLSPSTTHQVAAWGETVTWEPEAGTTSPTSFRVCISLAGSPCARPGQNSTTSIVLPDLPPTARTYRITGALLQPLLAYGERKALTWTVAACGPSPITGTPDRRPSVSPSEQLCTYARPRSITWTLQLQAPILNPPRWRLVNDRPSLSIQGPVEGAHHYIFCVVIRTYAPPHDRYPCPEASRDPSVHQDGASVSSANGTYLVNTGASLSTLGWEWTYQKNPLPNRSFTVPVTGLPLNVEGGFDWSVGACLNASLPCTWSPPLRVNTLPLLDRRPIQPIEESRARFRLEWPGVTLPGVTHYRVCLATPGSTFPLVYVNVVYKLIYFPGMLHDLCNSSSDIPPGERPTYERELPPEVGSFCLNGPCQMPRPVATYVAGLPQYILDFQEHPELAPFHGQTLAVAVAPCSGSNRNCLWDLAYSELRIPTISKDPSPVLYSPSSSSFSLQWESWWGNDYYIPCLREASATCESGNLLSHPRMNAPRGASTPQDHPRACILTGPSLSGIKVFQVAGCNDAWGCRWSSPQQHNFSSIRLPPRQSELLCVEMPR